MIATQRRSAPDLDGSGGGAPVPIPLAIVYAALLSVPVWAAIAWAALRLF